MVDISTSVAGNLGRVKARYDEAMRIVSLVLFALVSSGCVTEPYVQWEHRPPSPAPQGRVAIRYVVNKRAPEHGGAADPDNIGNWRSGFGIPYAIRLGREPNRPLDATLGQFVGEALASAGLGVTSVQDPYATSHLSIEILDFWCDGYMGYKATVSLMLVLLDPRLGNVRAQVPIQREGAINAGTGMWMPVQQVCRVAYNTALNLVYADIVNALAQPQVRSAALGVALAPPPAPPAPAAP
jgi:hypothetical protein